MASLAILIGLYSYSIFTLGALGLFYRSYLGILSLIFILLEIVWIKNFLTRQNLKIDFKKDKVIALFFFLLIVQILINLIGALGPELGFDALWYHLTLPKIYLSSHRLLFVPGNLLYYSPMPKLVEMIYTAALAVNSEILAKIIHLSFGILSLIALFQLAKRYLSLKISLLACVIFYTSLVVGWQSITAYVDLGRTFFEILALDYFLKWWGEEKNADLIESAVMLGLAISSKLLAIGSLGIFLILIVAKYYQRPLKDLISSGFKFILFSLLIPLPWFVFSFVHTGNPFSPLFNGFLDSTHRLTVFNLINFIKDFWDLFLYSADPISPVILIFLPFLLISLDKKTCTKRLVLAYCSLSYLIWYFTPRVGGGRFFLPYLPAFAIECGFLYSAVKSIQIKKIAVFFVSLIALINIGYRAMANFRFLPVVLGFQSKRDFLNKNLNFKFGDFYDVDSFFEKNIRKEDLVLIEGVHNLYYVNFPFVHTSWSVTGTPFTHLLIRGEMPVNYGKREPIYSNEVTGVKLFLFGKKP